MAIKVFVFLMSLPLLVQLNSQIFLAEGSGTLYTLVALVTWELMKAPVLYYNTVVGFYELPFLG